MTDQQAARAASEMREAGAAGTRGEERVARKLECASCWLSPADVAGMFLCEDCLPPMQPAVSPSALSAPAEAERAVVEAARTYVEYIEATQAAPIVSPGLTPTYAINLSRLRMTLAALRAVRAGEGQK